MGGAELQRRGGCRGKTSTERCNFKSSGRLVSWPLPSVITRDFILNFTLEQPDLQQQLERGWSQVWDWLQKERGDQSHWSGELSTSALSTATAISALFQMQKSEPESAQKEKIQSAIDGGCNWLAAHQNSDGGFGDTNRSHSNIATTYLVLAAWNMTGFKEQVDEREARAWNYVKELGEWEGLRKRYGKDKTFVVPILSNCALAGLVDWKKVPALPFEAAWLPQDWYRLARMPVVSYAIPALVAIGQARHHFAPSKNPALRWLRNRAIDPTLKVLHSMQPASGGYLEATPLTSFVLMNLAAIGKSCLPVAQECLEFLLDSMLEDHSWPIDTNLATWVTNLSLVAASRKNGSVRVVTETEPQVSGDNEQAKPSRPPAISVKTVEWILSCQHNQKHPFTGAQPGGWGWTDLSGAVPDSDDTPAALLSLSKLQLCEKGYEDGEANSENCALLTGRHIAVAKGLSWLLQLQNRDGGWPTFCRGWGKLPFDRSGTDLTAHALRALRAWMPKLNELQPLSHTPGLLSQAKIDRATQRGLRYLAKTQQANGSWLPLWFGNQDRTEEDNPIYGTSKVLLAYAELDLLTSSQAVRAIEFLRGKQNPDGGWGGGASVTYQVDLTRDAEHEGDCSGEASVSSTVEETALALETLVACGGQACQDRTIMRGYQWLLAAVDSGCLSKSWPIGFYFAKLWYHERLYPAVFSLGALGAALAQNPDGTT